MSLPRRLESYDPAYHELFARAAEGEVIRIDCSANGKAVYLCQRLRAFRKLLLEKVEKDKSLIEAARNARMSEMAQDGPFVVVRPSGGSWHSQAVMAALRKNTKVLPETKVVELPPELTPVDGPKKDHGYY